MNGSPASDATWLQAGALLDVHRPDEAIALLGRALASDPESYELTLLLAEALGQAGRHRESVGVTEQASRIRPAAAEPHILRSEMLLRDWSRASASAAADDACRLAPSDPRAHLARMDTALARNDLALAREAADRVAELAPYSAMARHARALVLLRGRRWREAEAEYRDALTIEPDDPTLLNNLGVTLLRQSKASEALDCFVRAGALDPRDDLYRKNAAEAAYHVTDGSTPLPRWLWKLLHPRRTRELTMAARVALEIERPRIDREMQGVRFGREIRLVLWLFIVVIVAAVILSGGFHRVAPGPQDRIDPYSSNIRPDLGIPAEISDCLELLRSTELTEHERRELIGQC
jgi:Flp pilus assembly protein TadD